MYWFGLSADTASFYHLVNCNCKQRIENLRNFYPELLLSLPLHPVLEVQYMTLWFVVCSFHLQFTAEHYFSIEVSFKGCGFTCCIE
jgi:hypothetical protein